MLPYILYSLELSVANKECYSEGHDLAKCYMDSNLILMAGMEYILPVVTIAGEFMILQHFPPNNRTRGF